jgi:hypothetical protein
VFWFFSSLECFQDSNRIFFSHILLNTPTKVRKQTTTKKASDYVVVISD